jgi:Tfp pilus assembly protein PilZ
VRRDGLDLPAVSRIQAEAAEKARSAGGPAMRKMRALPVQFGKGQALFAAMTGNVSESGLFVITLAPFDPGTDLRVLIDLDTGPLGLKGKVVWKRQRMVMGRPVGMGVQLIAPPEPYREFVLELP